MQKAQPPRMPRSSTKDIRAVNDQRRIDTARKGSKDDTKELPKWKKEARSFLFDILAAFIVLFLIVGGLYTYTDNWPPLVVVQSGSMQHSDDTSYVGVIDTGDLVFVKKVEDGKDIIPYYEGIEKDHRTYDSYGDVIIFRPNGNEDRTAIIHRAVLYVEFNPTDLDWQNGSYGGFDIPLTGERNLKGTYTIKDYEWPEGKPGNDLHIDLNEILVNFYNYRTAPHGGFITKGDDNPGVDQTSEFYNSDPPWIEPVKEEWVIGKSVGELPWFGIIKLKLEGNDNWPENSMRNLIIAMIVLVSTPFIIDIGIHMISRAYRAGRELNPTTDDRSPPGRGSGPPIASGKRISQNRQFSPPRRRK